MADDTDEYYRCSFSVFTDTKCGLASHFPTDNTRDYIKDCHKNILSHLRSLNLSQYSESLTEGQLICHRVGIFNSSPFLSVCPSHRFSLGLCWRKRTLCALPSHTGKCKADRTVTPTVSRGILSQKGLLIPVGSVLCKNCKGELTDSLTAFSEMVENGCNLDDGYSTRCKGECETESTELDNLGETNSTYLQADNITPTLGNKNTCVVTDDSLYLPVLIENSEVFDVITVKGGDITSSTEMKEALDVCGGVSGCQISNVTINTESQTKDQSQLKGITKYSNVKIDHDGRLTCWKAFGIGEGQRITMSSFNQEGTNLNVLEDFSLPKHIEGSIKTSNSIVNEQLPREGDLYCPEMTCSRKFKSYSELEDHCFVGDHALCPTHDLIKLQWKGVCLDISSCSIKTREGSLQNGDSTLQTGWGLKKDRKSDFYEGTQ
ncbi:uncharacterized protein LOC143042897 [Mytilus galloprovincialis]|uniref:uncharacterized protein LOC143042897 n=1 Tax=Mytilus galloprovincialis TaxID=29158 RepID=UPI003F7B7794